MPTDTDDKSRQEVLRLLEAMRQDYMRGSLKLYKEHLSEDAISLGIGDPGIRNGKKSCLEYLRLSTRKGSVLDVQTKTEDVRLVGDLAIVVESFTSRYKIKDESYRDYGRSTSILQLRKGRWYMIHSHIERLASNKVIP
jgi:ketosteroid isomerase-like protein